MTEAQENNNPPLSKSTTEKSPAFQFYPKDVLSDGNAMAMPAEAFGIYMRLLCYDWTDNGIVDDDKAWRRLGGFEYYNFQGDDRDPGDWDIILSYLTPQFIPHPTKEGYVTNPRLLKERANQKKRSLEAQDAANKRWEEKRRADALRTQADADANALPTQCTSSSSSSSSPISILTREVVCEIAPPAPDSKIEKPKKTEKPLVPQLTHVRMTQEEIQRIKADFPDRAMREFYFRSLDDWLEFNPKERSKDSNRRFRQFIRKDKAEGRGWFAPKKTGGFQSQPVREPPKNRADCRPAIDVLKAQGINISALVKGVPHE